MDNLISFDFTNIPEKDKKELVEKFKKEIHWIASGARYQYLAKEQLTKDLRKWGRNFIKELKEHPKFPFIKLNTSYFAWEYGRQDIRVEVLYELDYTKDIKSKEDFYVELYSTKTGNYVKIGKYTNVADLINACIENELLTNK
jgi:hypothetical protein